MVLLTKRHFEEPKMALLWQTLYRTFSMIMKIRMRIAMKITFMILTYKFMSSCAVRFPGIVSGDSDYLTILANLPLLTIKSKSQKVTYVFTHTYTPLLDHWLRQITFDLETWQKLGLSRFPGESVTVEVCINHSLTWAPSHSVCALLICLCRPSGQQPLPVFWMSGTV